MRSRSASRLLLLDGGQALLEPVEIVLKRRDRGGGLVYVLGGRSGLFGGYLERLYSPLESRLPVADRRQTALRGRSGNLALETIDKILEPRDADATCIPSVRVVVEQRP
jgi:hypothetical protein